MMSCFMPGITLCVMVGICLLAAVVICCVHFSVRESISLGVSRCVGGGGMSDSSSEYFVQLALENCCRGLVGMMMGYADKVAMIGR